MSYNCTGRTSLKIAMSEKEVVAMPGFSDGLKALASNSLPALFRQGLSVSISMFAALTPSSVLRAGMAVFAHPDNNMRSQSNFQCPSSFSGEA